MRKKIAILCGGPSSEHEVSLNSARTIFSFLDHDKYEIVICYISKDLSAELLTSADQLNEKRDPSISFLEILKVLKKEKYFALLAGIHGEFAEDGKLQALLEIFDIPYSGSKVHGSALAMDKYRTSLIAQQIDGLKFPRTFLLTSTNTFDKAKILFPTIVKPNALGSSVGVFVAKNNEELSTAINTLNKKFHVSEILLQEYITDSIELSCGTLEKITGEFTTLPPIEIRPKKAELFDYNSKYEIGGSLEITPPVSIPQELSDKVSSATIELHKILGLNTYSRSDFLVKNGEIYFLETNTLPGMTATSLLPQEAKAAGISFPDLLEFIIENS